jgi:hypothetical protein
MNKYIIEWETSDGFVSELEIYAANRIMALEVFMCMGFEDVVRTECRQDNEDEVEEEE